MVARGTPFSGRVAVLVLVAVALAAMVFVSRRASGLRASGLRASGLREGFDASNTDAGAAVAETALRDAPVSRVMTPFGAVRACGSANNVCGTRDGYFAGDLVVGENLGVAGDVSVKGNLAEVTNVSILRALSVNGLASFDGTVSVGGRMTAREAEVAGSVSAMSANVRGNLLAARLDIGGDARITGSAEVSSDLKIGQGLTASGAGWFGYGVGTGGNMVALGDVMAGGNHIAAGSVLSKGDIRSDMNMISGGGATFTGALTAHGDVDVKGKLTVKNTGSFGGALDVGQGVTVGGNLFAEGSKGVVVNNGAVRVGALPAGAEGGALASGVHVERGNGRRTSFPRSGDNLIDGTVMVGDKVCVGTMQKTGGGGVPAKKWVSKGCWNDKLFTGLPRPLENTGGYMSGTVDEIREKCALHATQTNRDIFAIQDGKQCMTGSTAKNNYMRDGASDKCKSMAGGPWLNSVWVLESEGASAGGECIDAPIIKTFKGYPTLFNGKISDAAAAANTKLADLANSISTRFSGSKTRMDGLDTRLRTNEDGLAAAQKVDSSMLTNIAKAESILKEQDDGIIRIDNRNDLQDVRLDTLERRLETLEGRMLGAVQAAMVNDQTRLAACESKPVPPSEPWKLTVWQDMGFTGNTATYDAKSMTKITDGVFITGGPFGVSSWDLQRGDTDATLYFSNHRDRNSWDNDSWSVDNKGTQSDFDFRWIIVKAIEPVQKKPICV